MINGLLAAFNLIPAFPLDGGRMLRAVLWSWKKDLRRATRIAAAGGNAFGILLIAWGVFGVVTGDFVGGMWRFLIGLFVRAAADAAYKQVLAREARSEEHTSELQSLMRISYAVFCLKKKT